MSKSINANFAVALESSGSSQSQNSYEKQPGHDSELTSEEFYDQDPNGAVDLNDPAIQKKLDKIYRKLDLRIIPALWVLYFLSMFGGGAYGVSLTMNETQNHSLRQKLQPTTHQLSTANALDSVGNIIFDIPMNLIMTRVAPQTWLSRIIISIGLVYACYASLETPGGLIAIRLFSGLCNAGCWPGLAYYISLWYPHHRTARRIGYYFTAAQIAAAVAGLVSAGFQRIDGNRGLTGYQWMFLTYGVITVAFGISLIWWLPDRPVEDLVEPTSAWGRITKKWVPHSPSPLNEEEKKLHMLDMAARYAKSNKWGLKELWAIAIDPRIWPLIIMYFGVVGCGIGLEVFATVILQNINPNLSSIDLSLLVAPIWLFDFSAILLVTPFSDMYKNHRGLFFSCSTLIIAMGLFITTYVDPPWSRWGGLLICGFGLGPTVPIIMTWAAEIFVPRHGDLGAAASAAYVSGLGSLGSVTTTYALYTGWPSDAARSFKYSNMVMVAILGISIIAAGSCTVLRWYLGDLKKVGRFSYVN